MAEGPIRRACNRCHAQKLSCKRASNEACERCVRLKTECKSSPSLRFRRNRLSLDGIRRVGQESRQGRPNDLKGRASLESAAEEAQYGSLGGGEQANAGPGTTSMVAPAGGAVLDMTDLSWGFIENFLLASRPNKTIPPQLSPGGARDEDTNDSQHPWGQSVHAHEVGTDGPQPLPVSSHERTISGYHCPVSSLASSVPQQQYHAYAHKEVVDTVREGTEDTAPRRLRHRILRRRDTASTMAAQQKWLAQISDINSALWRLLSGVPYLVESGGGVDVYACLSDDGRDDPDSAEQGFPIQAMFEASGRLVHVLQDMTGTEAEGSELRQSALDAGTGMLVLSTYVRLLDLYQKVFQLVHSELAHSSPGSTFRLCKLPDVSVGSFPVASALPLQMALTIRLAEDFLSSLRTTMASFSHLLPGSVTRDTNQAASGGQDSALWGVVDVSFTAIRESEQHISRELVEIRRKLETLST